MTDILPILRTFRRHRTAVGILVAEMALTTAILCNALHMIQDRVAVLTRPSHIDEARVAQLVFHGRGSIRPAAHTSTAAGISRDGAVIVPVNPPAARNTPLPDADDTPRNANSPSGFIDALPMPVNAPLPGLGEFTTTTAAMPVPATR